MSLGFGFSRRRLIPSHDPEGMPSLGIRSSVFHPSPGHFDVPNLIERIRRAAPNFVFIDCCFVRALFSKVAGLLPGCRNKWFDSCLHEQTVGVFFIPNTPIRVIENSCKRELGLPTMLSSRRHPKQNLDLGIPARANSNQHISSRPNHIPVYRYDVHRIVALSTYSVYIIREISNRHGIVIFLYMLSFDGHAIRRDGFFIIACFSIQPIPLFEYILL